MSGRGILDADMTTLGGLLRDGFRWWIDELAALVPPRFRGIGAARGPHLWFDGATLRNHRREAAPIARGPASVIVARALCLTRTLERPAIGERDLMRMLALDSDRIMPMPAGAALVAGAIVARAATHVLVEVAALPIIDARTLADAIAAAGIVPTRIVLAPDADDAAPRVDFLPAFREAGLLARDRSARLAWWGLVAFLFAFNIGVLIWRDAASVARLDDLVASQRPAAAAARAINTRITAGQRLAWLSAERRASHDALGTLAAVSTALPTGAWVQRYNWDGGTLKLAGYRAKDANVIAALRGARGFTEVRNAGSDAVAAIPAGQPFAVTARLVRLR